MPKIIAIIDDEVEMEEIYAFLLEDVIESNQVRLKFFSDSRQFALWLRFNQPALVMSDINMPYLTGPELGHRIKQTGKEIKTYFVSGDEESEHRHVMKELGVNRYLMKPINFPQTVEFIKTDLCL